MLGDRFRMAAEFASAPNAAPPAREADREYGEITGKKGSAHMSHPMIAVTMGDPAGIGPEIVVRALGEPEVRGCCRPVVVGDPGIMTRAAALVQSPPVDSDRAHPPRCRGG